MRKSTVGEKKRKMDVTLAMPDNWDRELGVSVAGITTYNLDKPGNSLPSAFLALEPRTKGVEHPWKR